MHCCLILLQKCCIQWSCLVCFHSIHVCKNSKFPQCSNLFRRHRDLEELHTREPGGPWKSFSCKHKDSSLAPQQSDRAACQLGLVGRPVCEGAIDISNYHHQRELTLTYAMLKDHVEQRWGRIWCTFYSSIVYSVARVQQCAVFPLFFILYIVANVSAQCSYAEPQNILGLSSVGRNWWQYHNK